MCEGDFTPIPADRNEHHDVIFPEAPALPSAPSFGQITHPPVQPLSQKYSCSLQNQITSPPIVIPHLPEGRIAIVADVGCGMGREPRTQDRLQTCRRHRTGKYLATQSAARKSAGVMV